MDAHRTVRPGAALVSVVLFALLTAGGAAAAPAGADRSDASGPLTVTSLTLQPSPFVLGGSLYINTTATGGAPPYSYVYSGLPAGCHTQNVSEYNCHPNEVAKFTIAVNVTDSTGAFATDSAPLSITSGDNGPPVIESVTVLPNPVAVGKIATIAVVATSNSSQVDTLAYFFWNLPPGCTTFNQSSLECLPSGGGSFHIGVQVTDGFGQPTQAHSWLNVTGGSTSTGSSGGAGGLPDGVLYAVPVVVVAIAVLVGYVLFRGSARRRAPPREYSAPPKKE